MKTKLHKILVPLYSIIAFVIAVAVFVLHINIAAADNTIYWKAAIVTVVALIFGVIFCSLIHELGHLIALKAMKAKITEFAVLGFIKKTENGKSKVKFSFKNAYNGFVEFIVPDPRDAEKTLTASLIGGELASITSIAFFIILSVVFSLIPPLKGTVASSLIHLFFSINTIYACFFMLVNFASLIPSSDGSIILDRNNSFKQSVAHLSMQSLLYAGKSLADFGDNYNFANCEYYNYLYCLQKNKLEEAKVELAKAEEFNKLTNCLPTSLFVSEKFFIAVIEKNVEEIEKFKDEAISFCDENSSPTTFRILLAYRTYTNESEWAELIKNSFEKMNDCLLKGCYLTEKQICDNYIA